MKLSLEQLHDNLRELGLMDMNDKPLSYSAFKNRASVHRYGDYKIVFVGFPKRNLFGFYVMWGNDSEVMREAYDMYSKLVKGDMEDYDNGDLQWGNCGFPLMYGCLRTEFNLETETI